MKIPLPQHHAKHKHDSGEASAEVQGVREEVDGEG
jgi:hypothetical protein